MRKRIKYPINEEAKLIPIENVCHMISMGRTNAVKFARACGAERKIGRSCRYDRTVIENVLDNPDELARVNAAM